ncbi:IS1634 family transposase [Bacteroides sp. 224]|uniref:IS1634 family transposase n=1 Tax=Bacteroides sp. 224 TaxID=2302936 RepID=UPI0013D6BC2D|nr:IS1634 family transposase [Bacteroides sp. 224]NDV64909.1 IS1634 family transposase [Bacteroides sp. 224]
MFIRQKRNKSGSISIQIISKSGGRYKVVQSIGSGKSEQELSVLMLKARSVLKQLEGNLELFIDEEESNYEYILSSISNNQIQVIGPELIYGRLFDKIGYNQIEDKLFRHLVITRLYNPGSKLKTIDYLSNYLGENHQIQEIYRFLDKLSDRFKQEVEDITFIYTKGILGGKVGVVFYDMTTLYFESSDEDDLRKTGFSKDGKHQCPQIFLGLLVGYGGNPIGYDLFEGNIFEGHTLIPVLEKFQHRFGLNKPIVIADSGLLSKKNIDLLSENNYEYILGGRPKNESKEIQAQILKLSLQNGQSAVIQRTESQRIIVSLSQKRAYKDLQNRLRGLRKLEKKIVSGKLTKSNINNRGYNKYLRMEGEVKVELDYEKFNEDARWDGIKTFVTNSKLKPDEIINNYRQLWFIERAFRMNKTDLRIRPIYHRLRHRIEAHICISFTAYTILLELERILKANESTITLSKAAELTKRMYQINVMLPSSGKARKYPLTMDEQQRELYLMVLKKT